MTYLLFPPGGAAGPCSSHSRLILCSRERFNSSQSLVFDAPRSRIKVMRWRSSASAPPAVVLHTLLLHFVDFPHLLSSVLRWMSAGEAVAEFNLQSSAFLHHDVKDLLTHELFVSSCTVPAKSLTFAWWACFSHCQNIVHLLCSSAFPVSRWFSPES